MAPGPGETAVDKVPDLRELSIGFSPLLYSWGIAGGFEGRVIRLRSQGNLLTEWTLEPEPPRS